MRGCASLLASNTFRKCKLLALAAPPSFQVRVRSLWEKYYADAHGLIFVMDSADVGRFEEARMAFGERSCCPQPCAAWVFGSPARANCVHPQLGAVAVVHLPSCVVRLLPKVANGVVRRFFVKKEGWGAQASM